MHVKSRVERGVLRAAMGLPDRLQRLLAGRPVTLDGATLAVDIQLMLKLQRLSGIPGAETLPLPRAREMVRESAAHTAGDQPIGSIRSLRIADLPSRLYVPTNAAATGPLLVFFHGGGFWCGDLVSHDGACRFLAEQSGVRVLSVEYRQGPEDPFPAAHDDALAAYAWAVEHAAELGADPGRIGAGGDSAGGNLAAVVAIEAARRGQPCAVQLLVYPATEMDRQTRSAELFAEGFFLNRAFMDRAEELYCAPAADGDPRLSPLRAELPSGLAPALVYTAGFDPLRDEGELYAEKLRAAGVEVHLTRFEDQIHTFFNIVGVGRTSRAANTRIAAELRASLV